MVEVLMVLINVVADILVTVTEPASGSLIAVDEGGVLVCDSGMEVTVGSSSSGP